MDTKIPVTELLRARRRLLIKNAGLVLVSLVAAGLLFFQKLSLSEGVIPISNARQSLAEGDCFDWDSIAPSDKIVWTDCSKIHKCARLLLPLDYSEPKGPKAIIAIRMLPAPNGPFGTNSSSYKGPIFFNPGGPGGSGTIFVELIGGALSTVVGPDFDIFGFDPRGTGFSYPVAKCFDNEAEAGVWASGQQDMVRPGDRSIPRLLARTKAVDEKCLKALGGKNETQAGDFGGSVKNWGGGRYMSSASVATDMLRMTNLLGRKKLQYWGFSYGTILGQYFAAMYPERIGRVVIDGVYNAESYRSSPWNKVTPDIEIVFENFFILCSKAGPQKCPLYAPKASDIRERVYGIFDKLDKAPIPIPFAKKGPIVLTGDMLLKIAFSSTYAPLMTFYGLAETLVAIENNNQTHLAKAVDQVGFRCNCQTPTTPPPPLSTEAFLAISCSDSDAFIEQESDIVEFIETKSKISPLFARVWANFRLGCNGWPIRAKERYTGPFTLPSDFSLSSSPSSESSPIILLSTRYDPVCPLSDAKAVHERLGSANSRLIIQESMGHCSLSTPSLCTALWVRAYFQEGKVPSEEEQVRCRVRDLPFIGRVDDGEEMVQRGNEELEGALKRLAEAGVGMKLF